MFTLLVKKLGQGTVPLLKVANLRQKNTKLT